MIVYTQIQHTELIFIDYYHLKKDLYTKLALDKISELLSIDLGDILVRLYPFQLNIFNIYTLVIVFT